MWKIQNQIIMSKHQKIELIGRVEAKWDGIPKMIFTKSPNGRTLYEISYVNYNECT